MIVPIFNYHLSIITIMGKIINHYISTFYQFQIYSEANTKQIK